MSLFAPKRFYCPVCLSYWEITDLTNIQPHSDGDNWCYVKDDGIPIKKCPKCSHKNNYTIGSFQTVSNNNPIVM